MLDDHILEFASNDAHIHFHMTENITSGNLRHAQFCMQDFADILRRYIPTSMTCCWVVYLGFFVWQFFITMSKTSSVFSWHIATAGPFSMLFIFEIHFPSSEYSHQFPDVTRGSGFVVLVSLRFSWILFMAFCFKIKFLMIAHDSVISIFGEIATPSALILLLSLTY